MHDVCIVGAGPAGLNAALVLGRCGRDVIVFDSGQPRNAASRGLHGYLTRDGCHPKDLRQMGRDECGKYPSVKFSDRQVASVQKRDDGFVIVTLDGQSVEARLLLLATGRIDVLPDKPGFREYYGHGVYHCPYCDGWEHRHERIAVYGECPDVVDFALTLLTWTEQILLCPTDPCAVVTRDHARLQANGITVATAPLKALGGDGETLRDLQFEDGTTAPIDAVFFTSELPQKSTIAQSLGCALDAGGSVICEAHAATGVAGLYVAGNVRGGVHLAIMAAAEGAEAAIAINEALADRELRAAPDGTPARDTPLEQRSAANITSQKG